MALNIIFTPLAGQKISGEVDPQQYSVDWQNFLALLNAIVAGLMPSLSGTGVVYVISGVPSALGGVGLVFASAPGPPITITGNGILVLETGGTSLATIIGSTSGAIVAGGTSPADLGVASSAGSSGYILTSNGAGSRPSFQSVLVALGLVGASNGVVIVTSGTPSITTGTGILRADTSTVTGDGVLVVKSGGAAYTTIGGATAGAIVASGSGADNISFASSTATGHVLTDNGSALPPSFQSISTALGLGSATGVMNIQSGNFNTIGYGSAGQVLTSQGASPAPTFQAPGLSGFIDQTASRAANGTVYQNTSIKPMWVVVKLSTNNNQGTVSKSDSNPTPTTIVDYENNVGSGSAVNMATKFWVMPLHYYSVDLSGGVMQQWLEYF